METVKAKLKQEGLERKQEADFFPKKNTIRDQKLCSPWILSGDYFTARII